MKVLVKDGVKASLIDRNLVKSRDQVLVKICYVGLSRSDLMIFNQSLPSSNNGLILGSEAVGVVVDDPIGILSSGQFVGIVPGIPGSFMGFDVDGVLVEMAYFNHNQLILSPHVQDIKTIALMPQVAASMAVVEAVMVNYKPDNRIALIGKNFQSLLLEIIFKSFNISCDMVETPMSIPDNCYDFVIESVITQKTVDFACQILKHKGVFILRTKSYNDIHIKPIDVINKEIKIIATRYANFTEALVWVSKNENAIHSLIGNVFDISNYEIAFKEADHNTIKKIFISFAT